MKTIINHINDLGIRASLMARDVLARERGQGALEYIAIVGGLVLMVALGFQIAGRDVFGQASTFVSRVINPS